MIPRRVSIAHALFLTAAFAFLGCAQAGDGPTAPSPVGNTPAVTGTNDLTAQNVQSRDGCRIIWGCYDIAVDPDSGKIDIVPLRLAEYTFNVTKFFQPPAGNPLNLSLTIVDATQFATTGRIDLDISFTHPFPGAPRLRGFDVMGVFMGNGNKTGFHDPTVVYPVTSGSDPYLINEDGYTRWMNATEFTQTGLLGFTQGSKGIPGLIPSSTINGYKYYCESLGTTDDIPTFFQTAANVTERGSFKAGSTLTRRFEIQFPMSGGKPFLRFQYAILASWAAATAGVVNPAVSDFPVAANLQEPIHLAVTDNGSTLYYVDATDLGGDLRLQIEVFDWQGAANPGGIPAELAHLWVEDANGAVIPGGNVDVLPTASVSAGCGNSSVFTVDIVGCTPQGTGRQEFLVTAESASPTDYDNGLGSPYPTGAPLAAFARFALTVQNTNPCPTPTLSGTNSYIYNVNDTVSQLPISGTNFQSGPQLAIEFHRTSGDIVGTNPSVISSTSAEADFDFTAATAGMYGLYFMNGCGMPASILANALEINTPPTSTGITGPTAGDATLGVVTYNANATDSDTDPVDTLTHTWIVSDAFSGTVVVGPLPGDPLSFNYQVLPVGQYNVRCVVSDGYPPADLNLLLPITRTNTTPVIATPTGQTPVWTTDKLVYNVVASDADPGQTLTYAWSLVPQGNPASYTLPGDPIPGDITVDFNTMVTGPGWWDLSCQVNDGSGAPNATASSAVFSIYVASAPYTSAIPIGQFNQVIKAALISSQGVAGCPSFWDSFYGVLGAHPFAHPDISVLSGPSLGMPGVMVIADELGALAGPYPPPPPLVMGFAHFTCPFASGNAPSWTWTTPGLFPNGPDMIPSVIHYDGSSSGEILVTNSQLTNKLAGILVPDPSAFQHYMVGGGPLNDLYTSLPGAGTFDVAVDSSAGFDMGSPSKPMTPPLYGLYTQDQGGILFSCGGPAAGALAANPVHILQFPSMGAQPVGTPVDAAGSVGVVAPIPQAMVGVGPGLFNITPGGPCPAGAITYPEPYYALAIDDDPSDNNFSSSLPQPVGQWVIAATIDGDRDVEIYEMDYAVVPPGPAPLALLATIQMGSFMGGNPNVIPLDCEFISNFSGFQGTIKPVWPDDLLAVLWTDPVGGVWAVDIYTLTGGTPTLVGISMLVPVPPTIFAVPGAAYRLDVDEVTGDIYVIHQDAAGTAAMAVTIIPY